MRLTISGREGKPLIMGLGKTMIMMQDTIAEGEAAVVEMPGAGETVAILPSPEMKHSIKQG